MLSIIKTKAVWFWFSGILIAVSIASIALWQFHYGIDFTGGSLIELRFHGTRPAPAEVQSALASIGDTQVQPAGETNLIVRLPALTSATHQDALKALDAKFSNVVEERFETIGPTIGAELRKKAVVAILIVFAAIIFYIAYTFRRVSRPISSWTYGLITVATALHDVAIPLGLFSLLGKFGNIEIGSGFVAAILTIMGYSINDTIVVLDRVRENLARSGNTAFEDIVEKSVHQSFARSLNTTVTTLLALVAIYFFGGESVKYFALALIAGIATGVYSSLFIAAPLLVVIHRRKLRGK